MANFRLKIGILLRGGSAGMANFRLKIVILMRRDRQEWRILGFKWLFC